MFSLDHIGILVPSLARASALFTGLGFTLTRRADHTRTNARGETESAGSSQSSVMFAHDYIELQEQTGPPGGHILSAAAEKHPGLHIIAVGVRDAAVAQAEVVRRGLPAGPVLDWGRMIDEPDREGEARFGFFVLPYATADACFLCWVQHKTPDLVRSPRLMAHANGALGLAGLIVSVPDGDDSRDVAHRLSAAGGELASLAPARSEVVIGEASITIHRRSALSSLEIGAEPYQGPRVTAFCLRFSDPRVVVARARTMGLATHAWSGGTAIHLGKAYETTMIALPG